ncbi:hypothetical protein SDC9_177748 [bioreactor metagenome]|uniref:Uncharacterized protein n=1 Tax=bioreactor metagenome TaxID=1076179 RepID=A0A645GU40_9ZZZZ
MRIIGSGQLNDLLGDFHRLIRLGAVRIVNIQHDPNNLYAVFCKRIVYFSQLRHLRYAWVAERSPYVYHCKFRFAEYALINRIAIKVRRGKIAERNGIVILRRLGTVGLHI